MNLFYHPEADSGTTIEFESTESTHIARVLRKQTGDILDITNGKGIHAKATIEVGKKSVTAAIQSTELIAPNPSYLELAIAVTKNNERTEWFVEKAVEIGINKITLLQCQHSERHHLKTERLKKVAISAMKQSLRFYLPEITELTTFQTWINSPLPALRCIAHCYSGEKKLLQHALQPLVSTCIAIGPEGDFSLEELTQALVMNFIPVSLGQSRLRTETAALAAVHTFEIVHQQ